MDKPAEYYKGAAEFRQAREELGLSVSEMAHALGIANVRNVRQCEDGTREVTGPMSRLVWMFMAYSVPPVFRR